MSDAASLGLFAALVFGVIVLPGLDMAFVLGRALRDGRAGGFAAVAGIVAGGVCHVLMTTLGVSVLLRVLPGAFNALLLAGALYLAWIGIGLLRSAAAPSLAPDASARPQGAAFRQGMLTALLNPKAYLFMLAVFPQFLRSGAGALAAQAALLWLIIAANQLCVYGGVVLLADRARAWLRGRPATGLAAVRGVGLLLIAAALLTGLEGWRRL
ncbi:MAG TPA: LysE family translocator [Mizugakiibacter sp.]